MPRKNKMVIQSVVIKKPVRVPTAEKIAKGILKAKRIAKPDITGSSIRFRNISPKVIRIFRTKQVNPQISLVMGLPKSNK